MHETDSYIDLINPINDSTKVFIDLLAYILYDHRNCICKCVKIASKIAETGKNDLKSTTPKLMVHKRWNVFKSRWGMKEYIHRLPGQGFGSSSTQHYPSVKQNRSDLSVFVCSSHADTQSERKKTVWPQ